MASPRRGERVPRAGADLDGGVRGSRAGSSANADRSASASVPSPAPSSTTGNGSGSPSANHASSSASRTQCANTKGGRAGWSRSGRPGRPAGSRRTRRARTGRSPCTRRTRSGRGPRSPRARVALPGRSRTKPSDPAGPPRSPRMSMVQVHARMPLVDDDPIREAASAVVARDGEEGLEVLVLERGASSRFLPGYVAFPGGSTDERGPGARPALVRDAGGGSPRVRGARARRGGVARPHPGWARAGRRARSDRCRSALGRTAARARPLGRAAPGPGAVRRAVLRGPRPGGDRTRAGRRRDGGSLVGLAGAPPGGVERPVVAGCTGRPSSP